MLGFTSRCETRRVEGNGQTAADTEVCDPCTYCDRE